MITELKLLIAKATTSTGSMNSNESVNALAIDNCKECGYRSGVVCNMRNHPCLHTGIGNRLL